MARQRDSWQQTFRALGASLIGVMQAELAVVTEAWQRSGKELAKVAGLVGAAASLSLLCLPPLLVLALLATLVEVVGWPLWGSALAVAGVVVLVILVLGGIAARLWATRFESPVATVQNQLSDHRAWWSERVLSQGESTGESTAGDVDEPLPGASAGDETSSNERTDDG